MDDGFDNCVKEEPKNQFCAREGTYKLVNHADYSRTNRVGYNVPPSQNNTSVKVSFVTLPDRFGVSERICFNHGRELYLYAYKGIKKSNDSSKPLDKRVYKNTSPTCHDFNQSAVSDETCPLLVGFSGGQVQLLDCVHKDVNRIFNDEQSIDKTRVTCVRWLPGSTHQFAVSHASGHLYIYSVQLPPCQTSPSYQTHRSGDGFTIHTCKSRQPRNPQFRWTFGGAANHTSSLNASGMSSLRRSLPAVSVNQFSFSPCGRRLAVVGGDGCLRVFNFQPAQSLGVARSYFGALTCVAWSPDGRYVAVGGEDDLVTVWSCVERRVAVRGRGHRSWVADVAFDPVMTVPLPSTLGSESPTSLAASPSAAAVDRLGMTADVNYRLGSVGQDTQLCLWDLGADLLLRPAVHKNRASLALNTSCARQPAASSQSPPLPATVDTSITALSGCEPDSALTATSSTSIAAAQTALSAVSSRLSALGFGVDRRDPAGAPSTGRRFGSLLLGSNRTSSSSSSNCSSHHHNSTPCAVQTSSTAAAVDAAAGGDPQRLIGTASCPRLADCPLTEPHISCRVSYERLSFVAFRDDCMVTGCSDGYICTWARPGRPPASSSGSGGTPVSSATTNGNSTVV